MADLRRCIGSAKFGIAAHDAPVADFPSQPSQKDGLGRMCKRHWTEYTRALRQAALARKATAAEPVAAKPGAARRREVASARDAKPAVRPVPKPAKKAKAAKARPTRVRLPDGNRTVDEAAEASQEPAAD